MLDLRDARTRIATGNDPPPNGVGAKPDDVVVATMWASKRLGA